MEQLTAEVRQEFERVVESERVGKEGLGMEGCRVDVKVDFESRATRFDAECIGCVEGASRDLFGEQYEKLTQPLTSGAGWFLFSSTPLSSLSLFLLSISSDLTFPPRSLF